MRELIINQHTSSSYAPPTYTTYPNMTEEEFYNECRIVKTAKYVKGEYWIHPAYRASNRDEESKWGWI